MNTRKPLPTTFAPAERLDRESLRKSHQALLDDPLLHTLYDAILQPTMILDEHRQILFANRALQTLLGLPSMDPIFGLRPGEAIGCMHACEQEGGCGTTAFCRECGSIKAIVSCLRSGAVVTEECRLLRGAKHDALTFRVCAAPVRLHGQSYIVFSAEDAGNTRRREALERIFFHDLMNTAVGVRGLSQLLQCADAEEVPEFGERIYQGANSLVGEIESQRELLAAETGQMDVHTGPVNVQDVLSDVAAIYTSHDVTRARKLVVPEPTEKLTVMGDRTLLKRIVGNMTKNALEAVSAGETVTVSCRRTGDRVQFCVHNPGVMPESVKLQIFQRSFSTKGSGRGLGTYSIRLLAERYLRGHVAFTSEPQTGTIFTADFPNGETPGDLT